jgi:hypothetical protein
VKSGKLYDSRGSNSKTRNSEHDIFYGKIAECMTAEVLHNDYGFPYEEPDFTIYDAKQKSWAPDLIYTDYEFAVKSTDKLIDRKKPSWIFQWSNRSGKYGKDDIFKADNSKLVLSLCYIDTRNWLGYIYGFISVKECVEKDLFDAPLSSKLFKTKKALYIDDLVDNFRLI